MRIFMVSVLVSMMGQAAFAKEVCGLATVFGRTSFIYAQINDLGVFGQIDGNTKDPNRVVRKLKNQACYCVSGQFDETTHTFSSVSKVEETEECQEGFDAQ